MIFNLLTALVLTAFTVLHGIVFFSDVKFRISTSGNYFRTRSILVDFINIIVFVGLFVLSVSNWLEVF